MRDFLWTHGRVLARYALGRATRNEIVWLSTHVALPHGERLRHLVPWHVERVARSGPMDRELEEAGLAVLDARVARRRLVVHWLEHIVLGRVEVRAGIAQLGDDLGTGEDGLGEVGLSRLVLALRRNDDSEVRRVAAGLLDESRDPDS